MQVGLACRKFAGEQIGRLDGDLPHRIPRADPVSREPYAGPGCGLRDPGAARSRGALDVPERERTERRIFALQLPTDSGSGGVQIICLVPAAS